MPTHQPLSEQQSAGLSEERLAEIRQREQQTTPGPWRCVGTSIITDAPMYYGGVAHVDTVNNREYYSRTDDKAYPTRNGEFLAHARQDIPDLLNEIDRLEGSRCDFIVRYEDMKERRREAENELSRLRSESLKREEVAAALRDVKEMAPMIGGVMDTIAARLGLTL